MTDAAATGPEALADELVEVWFTAEPLWPTVLGLPGYKHDTLADHSLAAEERTVKALRGIAERGRDGDDGTDDPDQVILRAVVIQQAEAMLGTYGSRVHEFSVSDGLSAPALMPLTILPTTPLTEPAKVEGYLARLSSIPSYVDTVIARHRRAIADDLVPPDYLVRAGIELVDRYLDAAANDPLAIEPAEPVAEFAERRDAVLAESVRPAYRRYRDFLATEVAAVARSAEHPGLVGLPGGDERYAALIRTHTTTGRTAEDLHAIGLRLTDELADEYSALGEEVFGTGEVSAVFDRLRTDPALRWNSGQELLDAAVAAIDRAESVAPQWFRSIPDGRCEVRAVPGTEAEGGTIAYYIPPALDGSRPGTYYANTHAATERPRYTAEAIAFHEAIPGHHFQISTAQQLEGLPLLLRVAECNAYIEGWGLYAERLADEMGLYSDGIARFGMLTQDSLRAGRLVVDTGLHAFGWSRRQAVDWFREHTPMSRLEIEAEVDRYTAIPGQALSYMVGRLEIQRLRERATAKLGEDFDIREFHDVVLGKGALPLTVLAHVVGEWIEDRRA